MYLHLRQVAGRERLRRYRTSGRHGFLLGPSPICVQLSCDSPFLDPPGSPSRRISLAYFVAAVCDIRNASRISATETLPTNWQCARTALSMPPDSRLESGRLAK